MRTKKPTIEDVKHDVERFVKTTEGETFDLMVFLLSLAIVGFTVRKLVTFTGYTNGKVTDYLNRAREYGIINKDDKIESEWFEEDGGLALLLDAMTMQGLLERTKK